MATTKAEPKSRSLLKTPCCRQVTKAQAMVDTPWQEQRNFQRSWPERSPSKTRTPKLKMCNLSAVQQSEPAPCCSLLAKKDLRLRVHPSCIAQHNLQVEVCTPQAHGFIATTCDNKTKVSRIVIIFNNTMVTNKLIMMT